VFPAGPPHETSDAVNAAHAENKRVFFIFVSF